MQPERANALEDLEGLPELAALRAKVGHRPMCDETGLTLNHKRPLDALKVDTHSSESDDAV
jgi:hypothetical protein